MKKIVFLALIILFSFPLAAYAASIGDAETQGQFKFGIGLDQEYVFKRDLKFKSISPAVPPFIEITDNEVKRMYRPMVKASFGVFDFLDVYIKLGTANYRMENTVLDTGFPIEGIETRPRWGFAYGGGLKAAYALKCGFLIGGDVQYLRHRQKFRLSDTYLPTGEESDFRGKATFQEWQVAPYVGMKIGNFTPYLGAKYSDVRIKSKVDEVDVKFKFKADDNVGAFVGISYKIMEKLKVNLEGRFIDETAMSFGLTYKF
jgi:opacity protein-like surface antigen